MIRSSMTKSDQKPIFQHFIMIIYFGILRFSNNINMLFFFLPSIQICSVFCLADCDFEIVSRSKLTIYIGIDVKINQPNTRTMFAFVLIWFSFSNRFVEIWNEIVFYLMWLSPGPCLLCFVVCALYTEPGAVCFEWSVVCSLCLF